jgi:hypothetical protein
MTRFVRCYGSGPLHPLVLLASLALTGYAMVRLFAVQPWAVAIWFVGAAVLHDRIPLPLYSLADLSALSVLRHRADAADRPVVRWIDHLRVPAFLSGPLLLVWFPLLLRLAAPHPGGTGLSDGVSPARRPAITGVLFAASAVALAVRLRRTHRPGDDEGHLPAGHGTVA